MNIDDIKPDTFAATRRCVADVVEIFAEHAPDAPPADHRLRREIGGAIEDAVDEGFVAGVRSVEIPPSLDDADMRWLIAQAVEAWEERWYGADRYYLVGDVVEHVQHVSQWKTARGWPAVWRGARRLVRLVETLGIDWPTDADLETAPEGGEA